MCMWNIALILAICLTSAVALPQRIAGGEVADIEENAFAAALLRSLDNVNFQQYCGGTILNNRSVLTVASCWFGGTVSQVRIRVGSAQANSGGSVHNVSNFLRHQSFNTWNHDHNIAVVRVSTVFPLGNAVRPASIVAAGFTIASNEPVWTLGWGQTQLYGANSNVLRRVQIVTQAIARCQTAYGLNFFTNNMMCAGWATGGRGSCAGDTGGPLFIGFSVIGVTSFGAGCGNANFPTIYTRVAAYTSWITTNA